MTFKISVTVVATAQQVVGAANQVSLSTFQGYFSPLNSIVMSTIANLIDWFGCYEVQHNPPLTLLPALAMPAIAALVLER